MISAIILTKNEEQMLTNCINAAEQLADEIIVIDNDSTDRTLEIARQYNAIVESSSDPSFSVRRELGAQKATGDWLLYIDADERVTADLAQKIKQITASQDANDAYIINRKDYYFGQGRPQFSPMHRLFKKSSLTGWHGQLHETPNVTGTIGHIPEYFLHFTHLDIDSMLTNTQKWSTKEAKLRFDANHPPVVWWRLIRVFFSGFWNSFVTQQGYKCRTAGWIEALYQGASLFLTYAKLWEMQNSEKIKKDYADLDRPFTAPAPETSE